MDWGQTGQEPGQVKISLHHHFPTQSFQISQILFTLAHLCQTTQPSTLARTPGKPVPGWDKWRFMAVTGAGSCLQHRAGELSWNHQDVSQQQPLSSSWGWCPDADRGMAEPGRARSCALLGKQQPWDAQSHPPTRHTHPQTLGQDHGVLTLACLYLNPQLFHCTCNTCSTFSDQFY